MQCRINRLPRTSLYSVVMTKKINAELIGSGAAHLSTKRHTLLVDCAAKPAGGRYKADALSS
jgi:hypothetical protein